MELYLYSPIRIYDVMLNLLNTVIIYVSPLHNDVTDTLFGVDGRTATTCGAVGRMRIDKGTYLSAAVSTINLILPDL
jgi:hypothetical protein